MFTKISLNIGLECVIAMYTPSPPFPARRKPRYWPILGKSCSYFDQTVCSIMYYTVYIAYTVTYLLMQVCYSIYLTPLHSKTCNSRCVSKTTKRTVICSLISIKGVTKVETAVPSASHTNDPLTNGFRGSSWHGGQSLKGWPSRSERGDFRSCSAPAQPAISSCSQHEQGRSIEPTARCPRNCQAAGTVSSFVA